MKKKEKKKRKKPIILLVMLIILALASIYLIYSISLLTGIENMLRIIGCILIAIIWITFLIMSIKNKKKPKIKGTIILVIVALIYTTGITYISYNVQKVVGNISGMTAKTNTYSTSIVTLKDNKVTSINDIKNEKIGILNDKKSIDGYQIPNEIVKSEKLKATNLVNYESYIDMLNDLVDKKINFVFLPTNYDVMFKSIDKFEDISSITKVIYTKDKKIKSTNKSNGSKITKPFTILLMGVDSAKENIANSSFNGDALMLITFNPKTLNATIMSIPRDSYVPIACFANQRKNKITHAAWYGEDCMIKTIEGFTGINIDYYFKINFKGVVKLVDTLGGVNIDVEYSFCEQNSSRHWGEDTVYVKEGKQTLNGEQALAYSRNRHAWPSKCSSEWNDGIRNDFIRGQHQQEVVKALLNKAKTIKSVDKLQQLLKTISNSMETNMNTSEILSFYDIAKDILAQSKNSKVDDLIGMRRLYLSGYDYYIHDYDAISKAGTGLDLYNYVLYKGSIEDIVNAMKINLGLKKPTMNKKFSFNVDTEYEPTVIGKGYYEEEKLERLPNFIGSNKTEATSYGYSHGIDITVKTVSRGSGYSIGQIIDQSLPEGMDIDYVKSMTITVVGSITPAKDITPIEKDDPVETPDNDSNELPDNDTVTEPSTSPSEEDNIEEQVETPDEEININE